MRFFGVRFTNGTLTVYQLHNDTAEEKLREVINKGTQAVEHVFWDYEAESEKEAMTILEVMARLSHHKAEYQPQASVGFTHAVFATASLNPWYPPNTLPTQNISGSAEEMIRKFFDWLGKRQMNH